jgi:hypothetical protein
MCVVRETTMKILILLAALVAGTCALTVNYTPAMAQAGGAGGGAGAGAGAGASGGGGAGAGSDVIPPGSKAGAQKKVSKKKKRKS